MTPIQLPRFDGKTPEERINQLETAFFVLIEQLNQNIYNQESGGKNNGTV